MAALPVKEAQCRQMFSSCGGHGAGMGLKVTDSSSSDSTLHSGPAATRHQPAPCPEECPSRCQSG